MCIPVRSPLADLQYAFFGHFYACASLHFLHVRTLQSSHLCSSEPPLNPLPPWSLVMEGSLVGRTQGWVTKEVILSYLVYIRHARTVCLRTWEQIHLYLAPWLWQCVSTGQNNWFEEQRKWSVNWLFLLQSTSHPAINRTICCFPPPANMHDWRVVLTL